MAVLDGIWRERTEDWTYGFLPAERTPYGLTKESIKPRESYINVHLQSLRITHVRRGLNKFFGAVHSYIALPHMREGLAEYLVFTTPERLKDIDAPNIDNVIQLRRRLLGPTPYQGGDVEMELALFSIKSGEMTGPFLAVLEFLSESAGVSFLSVIVPYVAPLKEGVKLLAKMSGSSSLEIGLNATQPHLETGCYVILRAPRKEIKLEELQLRDDGHLLDPSGNLIADYPYLVFTIEATQEKDDWFNIPELKQAYAVVQEAIEADQIEDAQLALKMFRRTALFSPDLLRKDAERIVELVTKEMNEILQPTVTAGAAKSSLIQLSDLPLYQ